MWGCHALQKSAYKTDWTLIIKVYYILKTEIFKVFPMIVHVLFNPK